MSAKLFGSVLLSANIPQIVASGATNTDSTVIVIVNNHTASPVNIYVGYTTTSVTVTTPAPQNLLSPIIELQAGQNKEFRGIALQAGYSIVVGSDTNGVTAISYGFSDEGV